MAHMTMTAASHPEVAFVVANNVVREVTNRYKEGSLNFETAMSILLDNEKAADDKGFDRAGNVIRAGALAICDIDRMRQPRRRSF